MIYHNSTKISDTDRITVKNDLHTGPCIEFDDGPKPTQGISINMSRKQMKILRDQISTFLGEQ